MHWVTLFVLGLSVIGCSSAQYQPASDDGDCSRACEVLGSYDCPEAKPTKKGASCVRVCEANREMLSISCVSRAQSLDDVRTCHVECVR